ncbi:MAG: MBOAT family protein [Leptospirales bacterium]|nr:MBOAT family protein [Leptospirales bacterium]
MVFSSITFLLFFAFVFVFQWYGIALLPERMRLRALHYFLLLASYFFYTFSVWQYGLLIAITTLIDYVAGLTLGYYHENAPDSPRSRRARALCLLISLSMNLGILGYFKYTDFFSESVIALLNSVSPGAVSESSRYSLLLHLILPVGISFFTFQSMSYTIDVYRKVIPVERDLLRFALFIAFFPQLVAGPIVTAKEFLPQLQRMPQFNLERMRLAARWFALGYFKKVVLADNVAPVVDQIFGAPHGLGAIALWVGAIGFWVQVYCDFSGYSDMAWGAAIFLGYELPENFRLPYLSRSITEHWQRWHTSLIRWNRDYLYIPLGGNRVGYWRQKFNIFFTMFVAGVWHGANWTYVLWGGIHGTLLALESGLRQMLRNRQNLHTTEERAQDAARLHHAAPPSNYFSRKWPLDLLKLAATSFVTIYFGTLFRAPEIQTAWSMMTAMLGFGAAADASAGLAALDSNMVWLAAFVMIAGQIIGWQIFERGRFQNLLPAWAETALWPVFALICIQIGASDASPFIYFVF